MKPSTPRIEKFASLGYVLSNEETLGPGRFLVLSYRHDGVGVRLTLTPISPEGKYDLSSTGFEVYNIPNLPEGQEKELNNVSNLQWFVFHEQMVRRSLEVGTPYTSIPPGGLGEIIDVEYTHADELSEDNPLRFMKFWQAPSGKNLTLIHTAEWMEVHLKRCQSEQPCPQNERCFPLLTEFIYWQRERRRLRQEQGVLGTNRPHISPEYPLSPTEQALRLLSREIAAWRQAEELGEIQQSPPRVSRNFRAEEAGEQLKQAREATDKNPVCARLLGLPE